EALPAAPGENRRPRPSPAGDIPPFLWRRSEAAARQTLKGPVACSTSSQQSRPGGLGGVSGGQDGCASWDAVRPPQSPSRPQSSLRKNPLHFTTAASHWTKFG